MIAPDKAPYPGLRPFERDESHLFFGRDDCVDAMIERLARTRFLAVLGSSGTGKSSLVKTGLLAGLEMGLLQGADVAPTTQLVSAVAERRAALNKLLAQWTALKAEARTMNLAIE